MQIWSEFSWSYASGLIVALYFAGPIVTCVFIWAFYKCLGRKRPVNIGLMTFFYFLWAFVGFLGFLTFWDPTLGLTGYYNLPAHKQAWARLAVVEKGTDRIVAHNLEMAQLKPWPLPTRYPLV